MSETGGSLTVFLPRYADELLITKVRRAAAWTYMRTMEGSLLSPWMRREIDRGRNERDSER